MKSSDQRTTIEDFVEPSDLALCRYVLPPCVQLLWTISMPRTKDASADSHNAEWISEQLIIVLEEFGPENFGAVVSDNGGGCENGRKLTKEKYPHVAIQRCMMHGFALIMGSVFGTPGL
ncbi:hypothetical protein WJX77_000008 [Trebouxia sp. C0004]